MLNIGCKQNRKISFFVKKGHPINFVLPALFRLGLALLCKVNGLCGMPVNTLGDSQSSQASRGTDSFESVRGTRPVAAGIVEVNSFDRQDSWWALSDYCCVATCLAYTRRTSRIWQVLIRRVSRTTFA